MARMQIRNAMLMFFLVWLQLIVTTVHLWRVGDHWTGGSTFIIASGFSILGVIALVLARRDLPKEGTA
jgi:hypothetical protein